MFKQIPIFDRKYAPNLLKESYQMAHALAIAPSKPNFVGVGTDTSRFFKSEDSGRTWLHSSGSSGKAIVSMGVRSVLFDPVDHNRIIAAGFAGVTAGAVSANANHGIYLSEDAGASWSFVQHAKFVRQGAKDPIIAYDISSVTDGKTMVWFAGDYDAGLLKSVNAGRTWRVIDASLTGIKCITPIPNAPGELFITTDSNLYRYTKLQTILLGAGLPGSDIHSIIALPDDPNVVFVACGAAGIYRSYDGGVTFDVGDVVPNTADVQSLAVSPVAPYFLYAKKRAATSGNTRLPMYSHDRGQTWAHGNYDSSVTNPADHFYWSSIFAPHPSIANQCMTISSGDGKCFITIDGGITWKRHGSGYTGIRVNSILFDDDTITFASTDFSIWNKRRNDKFYDQISESLLQQFDGEKTVFLLGIRPNGLRVATIGSYSSQCITFEQLNGAWVNETTQNGNFKQLTVAPNGHVYVDDRRWVDGVFTTLAQSVYACDSLNTLYSIVASGADLQVMTSINNGDDWSNFGGFLIQEDGVTRPPLNSIKRIRIDPHDESILYIASARSLWVFDGSLNNITGHASNTWVQLTETVGYERDAHGSLSTNDVVVDPYRPGRLFAARISGITGAANGVLKSDDYGLSWVNITNDQYAALTVYSIHIDPWSYELVINTDIGMLNMALTY